MNLLQWEDVGGHNYFSQGDYQNSKKKKSTTKNPQITMMELTSEQRKWWSSKVLSVVMLEIIELFTSVIGV